MSGLGDDLEAGAFDRVLDGLQRSTRSSRRRCALPTSILSGSMPGTDLSTRVRLLTQPPHDMPWMVKVFSVVFMWIP